MAGVFFVPFYNNRENLTNHIMPEHQNIEYKTSWHDDYLKWICGFANAQGGRIYIGKNHNNQII
jgi:predicted HTH transcriptional regulator